MKRLFFLLILVIPCYLASAQITAESLLDELPPAPENICSESSDKMLKFAETIRAVELKIETIQLQEKNLKEEAEEKIGFNQAILQDPTSMAKMTSIGAEIEQCMLKVNGFYKEYIDSKLAELEKIEPDFDQRRYKITQEYWDVEGNGGNVKPIQDKIRAFLQYRCDTLSPIQLKYIKTEKELLLKHWDTYEKMNALQDEASRICFTGYPCSTQNGGFLLDGIQLYLNELRNAYKWHPENAVMDELGEVSE